MNQFQINLETFHIFKCFHGNFGEKIIKVLYFLLSAEIISAFPNFLEIVNRFRDSVKLLLTYKTYENYCAWF
jgi:hypothetical protein